MKNITFITTGQPTTNPRLLKEVETLIWLGYRVKVIYCFYQQWATQFDNDIIAKYPGVFICCGGNPFTQQQLFFKTRIRQKISTLLFSKLHLKKFAERAISRTHNEAVKLAIKTPTDLYIAHNLGALPAAVIAAGKIGALVGYDAEDMHSGQYTTTTDAGYRLNRFIEQKYFSKTNYFTAASPLIANQYKLIYPFLNPVVIDNVFPKTKLKLKHETAPIGSLKLFWFSQTVGPHRGLELVITAIAKTAGPVELHLMGNCSPNDKEQLLKVADLEGVARERIIFHEPVAPDAIFAFAHQFDIGMASETGDTLNRDICLTNKIFTYIQSGLAVLSSDTKAQTLFLQQYPQTGLLYAKNDVSTLVRQLDYYLANPAQLLQTKHNNYQLGQTDLNWENESIKFIKVIRNLENE